ncbi:hypothetical protein [Azospirillum baldaniorum]|uniref:hypothetical protein n=1 Tax=Azospirillum baldaniorum TaxID=1064539 RepID=UPI001FD4AE5B|nr:hypothetical protein [Azospirillum baldaniorum]
MSLRRQKMSKEQDAAARRMAGDLKRHFVETRGGSCVAAKVGADYGVSERTAERWFIDLPPSRTLAVMREREGERFRRVLAGAEVGVLRFRRPRGDDAGGNA